MPLRITAPVIALSLLCAVTSYAADAFLYPMDFAPREERVEDVVARETKLEQAWRDYLARIDALLKDPDRKGLDAFTKSARASDLMILANDYGYAALKAPALAKLEAEFKKQIALAAGVLAKRNGIHDIGDVANLRPALHAAELLKPEGRFTPEMSRQVEELVTKYVDGKSIFWGFSRKHPYYLSGYNKETITMDVGSSVKLLYEGTGKFKNTMDAFDAAWAQLTLNGYELDNSPHYDTWVNLYIVMNWAMKHNRVEHIRRSVHFRMIFERMGRMIMANGECANYGKSMTERKSGTANGITFDEYRVLGGGFSMGLRWAYWLYRDPHYLYLARKFDFMNNHGKPTVTVWPKTYDLNFFEVKRATWDPNRAVSYTTNRLKGPGYGLDRGVDRAHIIPVQDKLILSTGTHPRSPTLFMDMSYTQSKAMSQRRMGIDNLNFNGTHTVSISGRPDEANDTNRILLLPDDVTYPGTGEFKDQKSKCKDATGYVLADYRATRVHAHLAYGEVEYSRLQYEGVHAKRRMALLNNGVTVVDDQVWTDAKYTGGKNAGTLYNIWSKVVAKGTNWIISTPKKGHLPDGSDTGLTSTLIYLAPLPGQKITLTSDIDFCVHSPLTSGKPLRFVSAIMPMPYANAAGHGKEIGDGIRTTVDEAGNVSVSIPYASKQTLTVRLTSDTSAPAAHEFSGDGAPSSEAPALAPLNAKMLPPYAITFGNWEEFQVKNFKAEFEMNGNQFRSVSSGGRLLTRGVDWQACGNVLTLTPAFAKSLTDSKARTDLTVKFNAGADVTLKLNGDTETGLTLFNARRSAHYQGDCMDFPFGYEDNSRMKATGADFSVTFYEDWLYRGKPTVMLAKDGEMVKLPTTKFRSMLLRKAK